MKYLLFLVLIPAAVIAAPPYQTTTTHRQRVTPGQSDYHVYRQPTGYYSGDGLHLPSAHVRTRQVEIVNVAQINPAYTSTYSPEGYDAVTQADILGEIRRLNVRIDQLQALARLAPATGPSAPVVIPGATTPGGVVPPIIVPGKEAVVPRMPPASGPHNGAVGLSVMVAKCAACHQAGKLLPDQRFTLLDVKGNLVALTDKQKLNILKKTYTGMMPPPNNIHGIPPLTDAEFAAIAELVN